MSEPKPSGRESREAVDALEKSIKRASKAVELIRTRKANLMAIKGTDLMAIDLVGQELATAEQNLANLKKSLNAMKGSSKGSEPA